MKPILLFLLLLLPCSTVLAASGNAEATQLAFSLYAVGVPVAESTMTLDFAPSGYGIGLSYRTVGVAKVFSGDNLDQSSSGTFEHDQAVPLSFKSYVRLHGQDRRVTLSYRDGNPIISSIAPPNEGEREIVPVALREHTIDSLSAMVDMLHHAAETGRCDLSHKTYDGRRLEVFESR